MVKMSRVQQKAMFARQGKKYINKDQLRQGWSSEKPISFNNKKYRVGKMSYGDYFLEPSSSIRSERDGFSSKTVWLERDKVDPYFYKE